MTRIAHCIFAIAVAGVILLASASSAWACVPGPPYDAWTVDLSTVDESEIAADGAFVFTAEPGGAPADVVVEVVDDDGDIHDGEVTEVLRYQQGPGEPRWIACPPAFYWPGPLYLWTPEESLEIGQDYQLHAVVKDASYSGDGGAFDKASAEFTAVEYGEYSLETPELVDATLDVDTERHGFECCDCFQCYAGCCATDSNRTCWYVTEMDRPRTEAEITGNEAIPGERLIYRVVDGNGAVVDDIWNGNDMATVVHEHETESPHCMSVEVEYLPTGETKTSQEICFDPPEEFEFGERDIDWDWPTEWCDDPPPDASPNDDAGAYMPAPDAGAADADSPDAGAADANSAISSGESGCHCAAGGAPVPLAIILLLGGWALWARQSSKKWPS